MPPPMFWMLVKANTPDEQKGGGVDYAAIKDMLKDAKMRESAND